MRVLDWRSERRYMELLDELAKYEDVIFDADGNEIISLDRLRELAEAEREGRVVVLPCKIGTPIFFIRTFCEHADDTGYCNVDLWYARKGYKRENGCGECPNKNLKKRVRESTFSLSLMDAKKVGHLHVSEVYFTKEEAEAERALSEKGEADGK
jgi:hypothetical protein